MEGGSVAHPVLDVVDVKSVDNKELIGFSDRVGEGVFDFDPRSAVEALNFGDD